MKNYEKQIQKMQAKLKAIEEEREQATKADGETIEYIKNVCETLLTRYNITVSKDIKQNLRKLIKLILRSFDIQTNIVLSELEKDFNTYAKNYKGNDNKDGGDNE